MSKPQIRFERRLRWLALAVGLPGTLATVVLLWTGEYDPKVRWTVVGFVIVAWAWLAAALIHRVVFPLQTLANLLGGLREGDFSTRGRGAMRDDALGEVMLEANALAETLREQRLGALEATALLRTVMEELDAAVLAFDERQRVRLLNRAAEQLLGRPAEQLLDRTATELGLEPCLSPETPTALALSFPTQAGRFSIRRSAFRQGGRPHQVIVLTDLSRALREEERQAWQRLVRVLSHELNNSLAPIKSLAGSVDTLLEREPLPPDWREDSRRALAVIASRADSLTRFTDAYARLARLPPPKRQPLELEPTLRRVAALETRVPVQLEPGPTVSLLADADQLEQLLINLLRNAAEATLEASGARSTPPVATIVSWAITPQHVDLFIRDTGPGLANPANLFVPFFTTKPRGSGIGLILSRQIAENHNGTLRLENRTDVPGCVATVRLPRE